MTPDMVAALERQQRTERLGDDGVQHHWALVGEGISVDLVVFDGALGPCVAWMGAHGNRPFTLNGEAAEVNKPCRALAVNAWCVVDCSPGDRLMDAWATTRDDAPIWAALEALAGEVER